ncbi:hypothetical protein FA363_25340, partial [Pseudomonas aeruginosa]|nr:hypothetical protein [Pseudomonas aeruginosa]
RDLHLCDRRQRQMCIRDRMVLGPEEGYRFAEKHRLAALFVSRQGNGFDSRTTPRYEQLFGNQGERP